MAMAIKLGLMKLFSVHYTKLPTESLIVDQSSSFKCEIEGNYTARISEHQNIVNTSRKLVKIGGGGPIKVDILLHVGQRNWV